MASERSSMELAIGMGSGVSTNSTPSPSAETTDDRIPRRTFGAFMRKYFLEGQKLNSSMANRDRATLPFAERYRNWLAFLLPFGFFQLGWWSLAIRYSLFERYAYRYQMPLTMIVGAFVSGATSEGGGAVAFPVMTLLLRLDPTVARDFSLMIQSCGMAASGFTVLWMRIKVEWHSIILCSVGAAVSVVLGVQFFDDVLTPAQKKMMFVSVWFAFAFALLMLNRQHKRRTYDHIENFGIGKAIIMLATGFVGGLLTALTGSGVDICSFCVLTLLFRVSEKVATPTSVVLMWVNTWVGFYWRQLMMDGISPLAWEYFSVSVPVVVTCSPLGALVASVLHRQVLATFVYILETLAVVGFLLTKPPVELIIAGVVIIIVASAFFLLLSRLGGWMSEEVNTASSQSILFDTTPSPSHGVYITFSDSLDKSDLS